MDIEIWNETEVGEPLRLRLERCGTTVRLIAVDRYGDKKTNGNLVVFTPEGALHLCEGVNKTLGLKLDKDYKLELR